MRKYLVLRFASALLVIASQPCLAADVLQLTFDNSTVPFLDSSSLGHAVTGVKVIEQTPDLRIEGKGVKWSNAEPRSPAGGGYAVFDGGSFLEIPPKAASKFSEFVFPPHQTFTLRFWFKSPGIDRGERLDGHPYRYRMHPFHMGQDLNNLDITFDDNSYNGRGLLTYWRGGGGGPTITDGRMFLFTDDRWHHYWLVREKIGERWELNLYVGDENGKYTWIDGEYDDGQQGWPGAPIRIGCIQRPPYGNDPLVITGLCWLGALDDIRISTEAIHPCVAPPNTTMVAWYSFDETNGTTSKNLATGNMGVQSGDPSPIPGMVAGALRFDGIDDYLESPSSIVTNVGPADDLPFCSGGYSNCRGDFSIDAWIRLDPTGSGILTILDKRSGSPPAIKGYAVFVFGGSLGLQLADGVGSGFSNYLSPALTPELTDGDWHHIAVTVRRTATPGIRWYHNGALIGINNPTNRKGSLENSSPLRIGTRTTASPLTGWFKGDLDELEIYNRALTPEEIARIFNAGAFGKCKGN